MIQNRLLVDLAAKYECNPTYNYILDFPFHEYGSLERKAFWKLVVSAASAGEYLLPLYPPLTLETGA